MEKQFSFIDTPIEGLKVVKREIIEDSRGFLSRIFCVEEFLCHGFDKHINQINQTLTYQKGAVRGMHYQLTPYTEIKFVSCMRGEVYDVAVDLRQNSPTFLHWHGEILSEKNRKSMLIPEGFAHGFQALSDNCELLYLHSAPYNKSSESAININDPKLAIKFPLTISALSERDKSHPMIDDNFKGITI